MIADGGAIVAVGEGRTVRVKVCVSVHPFVFPVTVYVVVTVGNAFTVDPTVALNPAEGAQVYVEAPFAVIGVTAFEHTLLLGGTESVTVGYGVMITVVVAVLVHPLMSVPITV